MAIFRQRLSRLFESGTRRTTFSQTAASPRFGKKWSDGHLILTGASTIPRMSGRTYDCFKTLRA